MKYKKSLKDLDKVSYELAEIIDKKNFYSLSEVKEKIETLTIKVKNIEDYLGLPAKKKKVKKANTK